MKFSRLFWMCALSGGWVCAPVSSLHAQLAITEVMSSASQFLGTNRISPRPDFWELTNFGTNTIDLTGCRFSDSAGLSDAFMIEDSAMFDGRQIGPNESIIFFQRNTNLWTDDTQFRTWWGDGNLPANLQIYSYIDRGFGSTSGDAVQMWRVTSASTTLVDRVELTDARRGITFTYNPLTGLRDSFSEAGENFAFKAVETDDVGSPGFTTGRIPLAITPEPQGLTVDGGTPAVFRVQAAGLPRPRYQWWFNGVPVADAVSDLFEIPAAQPVHAGDYSVEVHNGLETRLSMAAVLEVNTMPTRPSIVRVPADLIVAPGQTATFQVRVRGYELPTYQWRFNGVDITDATNASLSVVHADYEDSGLYSVLAENSLGSASASAVLTVQDLPKLVITEVMGCRSTNTTIFGRGDWWELTNFDTYPVNLRGYRFDDNPGVLEGSVVITNEVIIRPGESVLFIQNMTVEFFTEWWGAENLPENVQFVRYAGNGLNAENDAVWLWNATPVDGLDYVHQALYQQDMNPDFTLIGGPSETFWCEDFIDYGRASVVGECGAVRAARSDDVGSPGYVVNHPPRPRAVEVSRNTQGVHLTWKIQPGHLYELQGKADLDGPDWTTLRQYTAESDLLITSDTDVSGQPRRFYRLRLLPQLP